LNVGQGTPVTGTFNNIDWETNAKFLNVEMDTSGGSTYAQMGIQQMLSVPYAINAANGNWNKSGNDIYNSNNGNVGIGTTTPKEKLEVVGVNAAPANTGSSSNAIVRFHPTGSIGVTDLGMSTSPTTFGWIQPRDNNNYANNYNLILNPNGGNIGIGTISPTSNLHIAQDKNSETGIRIKNTHAGSNSSETIYFENEDGLSAGITMRDFTNSSSGAMFMFNNRPAGHIRLNTNGNTRIYIGNNGDVGIGNTSPSQKLHVSGNGLFTGTVTASCGTLICSDVRYKKSIMPIEKSLDKICAINGVSYFFRKEKYPDMNFNDEKQIGIIAQELETIYPELVFTNSDGYKSVDYSKLTPLLVEAIKELRSENEKLKADNFSLRKNDELMKLDIEQIKSKLGLHDIEAKIE
jgi:hypothetical protein